MVIKLDVVFEWMCVCVCPGNIRSTGQGKTGKWHQIQLVNMNFWWNHIRFKCKKSLTLPSLNIIIAIIIMDIKIYIAMLIMMTVYFSLSFSPAFGLKTLTLATFCCKSSSYFTFFFCLCIKLFIVCSPQ